MLGVELRASSALFMPYVFSMFFQYGSGLQHDFWKPFLDNSVLGAVTILCVYFIRDSVKRLDVLHAERMSDAKEYSEKLESIVNRLNESFLKDIETKSAWLAEIRDLKDRRLSLYGRQDER